MLDAILADGLALSFYRVACSSDCVYLVLRSAARAQLVQLGPDAENGQSYSLEGSAGVHLQDVLHTGLEAALQRETAQSLLELE